MGGTITDVQVQQGHVYLATGRKLIVYTQHGATLDREIALPGAPRRMSASGQNLALAMGGGDIHVVDATPLAPRPPRSASLAEGELVATVTLDGDTLAVGTTAGSIVFFEVPEDGPITPTDRVDLSEVIDGRWQVDAVGTDGGAFFAAIRRLNASPLETRDALIAIRRGDVGRWTATLVARIDDIQQSQKVEVIGDLAFVMTVTNVWAVHLGTGAVRSIGLGLGAGAFPHAIAAGRDRLHVLTQADPLPADRTITLTTLDASDPDHLAASTPIRLDKDAWDGARLIAGDGHAYLAGLDFVRVYEEVGRALGSDPVRTMTLAEVRAAYVADGEIVAASHRGLCGFDLTGHHPAWCAETGMPADKLIPASVFVIGLAPSGLFTAKVENETATILSQVKDTDPRLRYIDAVAIPEGALALVDINPPRAARMHFRLDRLAVDDRGTMVVAGQDVVETPDCGNGSVALAIRGTWLGLLCGQQVLEFSLDESGLRRVTEFQLPAVGTTLQIGGDHLVVVGTTKGLLLFDRTTRATIATRLKHASADANVMAAAIVGDCVVVVQGGLEMRVVIQFCPAADGAYDGDLVHRYWRGRDVGAAQMMAVDDGFVIVSGSGTAIYLQRESVKHRIYLPALGNTERGGRASSNRGDAFRHAHSDTARQPPPAGAHRPTPPVRPTRRQGPAGQLDQPSDADAGQYRQRPEDEAPVVLRPHRPLGDQCQAGDHATQRHYSGVRAPAAGEPGQPEKRERGQPEVLGQEVVANQPDGIFRGPGREGHPCTRHRAEDPVDH